MLAGLQAAQEMAEHIAGIHAARAARLADHEAQLAREGEAVAIMYTEAEMARARASVASGLASAFRQRAEQEDTAPHPIPRAPWWRRLARAVTPR